MNIGKKEKERKGNTYKIKFILIFLLLKNKIETMHSDLNSDL